MCLTNSKPDVGYILETLRFEMGVEESIIDAIEKRTEGWQDLVADLVKQNALGVNGERILLGRI